MRTEDAQAMLFAAAEPSGSSPVRVIGVGDAGCRTASETGRQSIRGVEVVCVDTDSTSLDRSHCDRTLLLGAASMRGFGSGGDVRKVAAMTSEQSGAIRSLVAGAGCVVVVAGLAGGTGGGAAPVICEVARETGALIIVVPVMPFEFEPLGTHILAADTLDRLKQVADAVLEVPHTEQFVSNQPGVGIGEALDAGRRSAALFVATVAAIVTAGPGRCDANPGDLRSVLSSGATAVFGSGAGYAHAGAAEAAAACLEQACSYGSSPLDLYRVLVLIESGPDLPVSHIATITAAIEARLNVKAELKTAVMRSRLLAGSVRVSLIGSRRQVRRPLIVASAPGPGQLAAKSSDSVALVSSPVT